MHKLPFVEHSGASLPAISISTFMESALHPASAGGKRTRDQMPRSQAKQFSLENNGQSDNRGTYVHTLNPLHGVPSFKSRFEHGDVIASTQLQGPSGSAFAPLFHDNHGASRSTAPARAEQSYIAELSKLLHNPTQLTGPTSARILEQQWINSGSSADALHATIKTHELLMAIHVAQQQRFQHQQAAEAANASRVLQQQIQQVQERALNAIRYHQASSMLCSAVAAAADAKLMSKSCSAPLAPPVANPPAAPIWANTSYMAMLHAANSGTSLSHRPQVGSTGLQALSLQSSAALGQSAHMGSVAPTARRRTMEAGAAPTVVTKAPESTIAAETLSPWAQWWEARSPSVHRGRVGTEATASLPMATTSTPRSPSDSTAALEFAAPSRGSSAFRGVCRRRHRWLSQIQHQGKKIHIGCYATQEQAARAYDHRLLELNGPEARAMLNFPDSEHTFRASRRQKGGRAVVDHGEGTSRPRSPPVVLSASPSISSSMVQPQRVYHRRAGGEGRCQDEAPADKPS